MTLRLSVLDQSTIVEGRDPASSIRESIALAQHAEALGYARYWCAEHHASAGQAGTAPEILIAAIAMVTDRIRVGSAGVMLPHYASLKVAEQFRVLEGLAPGRIDLGLGRAPGSDYRTARALNPLADQAADHFPEQVRDLRDWLAGTPLIEGHPFRDIVCQPSGPTVPEMWILGSSDYGAQVAAYFGLPFCFAAFITDGAGLAHAFDLYREGYRPSARHPAPYASACVWALAAESEAEAERQVSSRAILRLWRDQGRFAALPSPEAAIAARDQLTAAERARYEQHRTRALHGTGPAVAEALRQLADEHRLDEIAVLTTMHDAEARRRSYALLAAAAGLS
ncbi:MAG: LLM class flavin-dependent oxidoreductase [Rhodospirillales bacterium]|nr:LLM class flavin-dependent oxidoreductase [Rhodospirillales bacterium]